MRYVLALCVCAVLSSCSVDDALARAERGSELATAARAAAQQKLEQAEAIAAQLKVFAVTLDSDKAKYVAAQAEGLIASAKTGLATADKTLGLYNEALDTAKAAKAAGGGILDILLGVAGTLVPAAGGAIALFRQLALHKTAIVAATNHADRMENAETADDVKTAKHMSELEQSALGVSALIEKLRST